MTLDQLIARLEALSGPDLRVDEEIARHAGYTLKDEGETRPAKLVREVIWIDPLSGKLVKAPAYTASLERAYELSVLMFPKAAGGVSWGDGKPRARINDGPKCTGANEAIALCVATLKMKKLSPQSA